MTFDRKTIVRIIAVLGGLIVIGLIVYALIPRSTILFSVAPDEVIVNINGKNQTVRSGERVTVSPGEVTITVQQDEFGSFSNSFVVENGELYEVLVALDPQTAAARSLLESESSQIVIQRIGGKAVEDGAAALRAEYPLISELPIVDRFYKIIACESREFPDEPGRLAVCVQLFDLQARDAAIKDIENRGFKLADYEVIFQDLTFDNIQELNGE